MRMRDPDELGVLVAREVDVAAVGDARDDELRHAPEQLLVVERLAQLLRRLEEQSEPGARALGLAAGFALSLRCDRLLGDVACDVDDELDAAVGGEDRRRAERDPMLPVVRFGADADDARALGAAQRLRRRQGVECQPSPLAVEHVVEPRAVARRERDELVAGLESDVARRGVVGEQEPALAVRRGDPFIDRPQDARELLARLVQGYLRPRPVDDRGEVVPDRSREQHLAVAPAVRRVAVDGDSPEQLAAPDERDEGERPDALLAHDPLERDLVAGVADVLDEDRLGIVVFRLPRRAPLGVRAVAVGEAAPGAEAEHAGVVGKENRGAVGAGCLEKRLESRGEHVVERGCAGNGVGESVDGVEVAQAPAELFALADVARRPEQEAKLAFDVAHGGPIHLEPPEAPALPAEPDRHGVDVGAGGDLHPGRRRLGRVVRVDHVEHRNADERGGFPAHAGPGRRGERSTTSRRTASSTLSALVASGSVPLLVALPPKGPRVSRRSLHDPWRKGQRRGGPALSSAARKRPSSRRDRRLRRRGGSLSRRRRGRGRCPLVPPCESSRRARPAGLRRRRRLPRALE